MRFYQTTKLDVSNFPEDAQETISVLASIYNPMIDALDQILNGNVDFENLNQVLFQIDVTVDSTGKPVTGTKVNLGSAKSQPSGMQVVRAQNLTSATTYPSAQPFISYTPAGNGLVNFNNISGLQANNKYRLTVVAY